MAGAGAGAGPAAGAGPGAAAGARVRLRGREVADNAEYLRFAEVWASYGRIGFLVDSRACLRPRCRHHESRLHHVLPEGADHGE
jgi:hypothetical protein